ncbi:extracellular solute-binding protein [Paenibacillus contaminans]|uniref:ABC transporter substrate-binding protein n=1 Tax=Paenibacillus contaminans TaxID=450362 RepID=A0A329LS02_9BACL|nr:extracellular solute-binding protein [Paenibacillus contaminans]RAV09912.1 hypothetical protein DQG23_38680 [Paenibacillus contaminans]
MRTNFRTAAKIIMTGALAAAAVGCTAKDPGQSAGESAKPAEKTTYNMFMNRAIPDFPPDGGKGKQEMLKGLEKAGITGADWNLSLASGQEYYTKLNLLASSGELPDYFNIDIPTMAKFAEEGLIMPLDDFIKKMPNASKTFRQTDLDAVTYNGKIYAIPTGFRPEPFNGPADAGFNIRKDWLTKVGLQEPKTVPEFYEVLKAFTAKDPDGNGKNDTYGLGGTKTSNFEGIFAAYGVVPSFWQERDGKLKQGSVLPETKEALKVLNGWYKEGLIDPEFVLSEVKQKDEKFINSKVGIIEANAFNIQPSMPYTAGLKKSVPAAEVGFLMPPAGPEGKSGMPEPAPAAGVMFAVSAKAKNLDLLAKVLDWTASDQPNGGFMTVAYGVEGEHYTYDKEKNRVTLKVNSFNDLASSGFSNPVQFVKVVDKRWITDEALQAMELANKYLVKNDFWKTVPAMLDYPDLKKLWEEYFVKIVTGEYTADKWDDFVKAYYKQGGQQVEDQVNAEWKKVKK